mmetsp:Transcript_430/g.772  ORF Transcript_430/g.772 Transcript_430/m.772 type:complete len:114 (+) Transcript_430:1930-2271(+)
MMNQWEVEWLRLGFNRVYQEFSSLFRLPRQPFETPQFLKNFGAVVDTSYTVLTYMVQQQISQFSLGSSLSVRQVMSEQQRIVSSSASCLGGGLFQLLLHTCDKIRLLIKNSKH